MVGSSEGADEPPLVKPLADFLLEQSQDDTLKHALKQVAKIDKEMTQSGAVFNFPMLQLLKIIYTEWARTKRWNSCWYWKATGKCFSMGLIITPWQGTSWVDKTLVWLIFYWPGIHCDICKWCVSCRKCQLVNLLAVTKVPLCPLPLIEIPFNRIGMDLFGSLDQSARGHHFMLALVDYVTQYPEATPLRIISMKSVAEALFQSRPCFKE